MRWFNIYNEIKDLKDKVCKMGKTIGRLEIEREILYKQLVDAEVENGYLRKERDSLKSLCKIKDRIIRGM